MYLLFKNSGHCLLLLVVEIWLGVVIGINIDVDVLPLVIIE